MITNSTILYVKDLLKHNKIQQVSKNLFKIENHIIKIQSRKGATLILCDCLNHTLNCNSPAFCVHKLAVINFIFNRDTNRRFDTLIALYKNWKEIKLPISVDIMIHDLQNVRDGFT